jgi:cytochrome c556
MRFATALAAVAVVAFGVTAVLAQQDPIAARKALMKANGQKCGRSIQDGQG